MKISQTVYLCFYLGMLISQSCRPTNKNPDNSDPSNSFIRGEYGYDLEFLKKYNNRLIELKSEDGKARLILSGDYQGRVMTSTANGLSGISFGWLNYDLISSGEKRKQFNPIGGEERFWMGPEGGQYSIYFKNPDSFIYKNWQVPSFIDTDSFDIKTVKDNEILFSKDVSVTNYSGTDFNLNIERAVTLLNRQQLSESTGLVIPDSLDFVGYRSINTITNTGEQDWTKKNGLLSVWLLGMFTPTPSTVVIIPLKNFPDTRKYVTDDYFGTMPAERLSIIDSVLVFNCDGLYRSKIGIAPEIAKPLAAGFDFSQNALTLVIPEIHPASPYVNSKWEIQKNPYKGDVINSYNDGPLEDGTQMGPFYEIESSSPAMALKKGESFAFSQTTVHIRGDYEKMKLLLYGLTGLNLDQVKR